MQDGKIPYITVQDYSLGQNIMEPQTQIPFHCLRLRLSSWQFVLQTPMNRSQQLPAPYKRLIGEIKQN